MKNNPITHAVFDFDGTCTRITSQVYTGFLKVYYEGFANQMASLQMTVTECEWNDTLQIVTDNSPHVGWQVATTPSAPAAADPYILAFEAASYILRAKKSSATLDSNIFLKAYRKNPATWREDAESTFSAILAKGIKVFIISNSATTDVQARLQQLHGVSDVKPQGGAAKYRITELAWGPQTVVNPPAKNIFADMPVACTKHFSKSIGRPIYLHRASYFESIYNALNGDLDKLATTLFVGDIWELDLAMPSYLNANVHLIERAAPFNTYDYERELLRHAKERGRTGTELSSVLEWF